MASVKCCLLSNNFERTISESFREARYGYGKEYCDISIACEDEQILAHKIVLSGSSAFFKQVLQKHRHTHPLIYLKDVKPRDLEAVLDFVYLGEVYVDQAQMNSFLKLADDLKLKGFTNDSVVDSSATTTEDREIDDNCLKDLSEESLPNKPSLHPHLREEDFVQRKKRSLSPNKHHHLSSKLLKITGGSEIAAETIVCNDVPKEFHKGGEMFKRAWDEWIMKQNLQPSTVKKYSGKMGNILNFLEGHNKNLKMDKLLFPLEFNVMFPPLSLYLEQSTTLGDKISSIKTYLKMCQLIQKKCSERYSADSKFSLVEKATFELGLSLKQIEYSKKLKGLNNQTALQTQVNAAEKQEKEDEISYKPQKLQELMVNIMNHGIVKRIIYDLTSLSSGELKKKYKEIYLRHFFMSLLLVTGLGPRPCAVAKCTVSEFNAARDTEGTKVMMVKKHKMFMRHGPCPIAFVVDNLYEGLQKYLTTFRANPESSSLLFATKKGKAPDPKHSHKWLKNNILKDICSEAELACLTPKSWRKGWTNWADDHPDPDIQNIAAKVMCHSTPVKKSNYSIINIENAARFGKAVVGKALKSKPQKITKKLRKIAKKNCAKN